MTTSLLRVTIAGDTPEVRGMARLVRTQQALDAYLAQGPIVTLAMGGLQVGRVRLVVTVAGQAPIALVDDILMARATSHRYAALGLCPRQPADAAAERERLTRSRTAQQAHRRTPLLGS